MTMKTQPQKSTECLKSSSQREVHSNTNLPAKKKKTKKISNKQPNPLPKRIRKRRRNKTLSHPKEGNHKDQRGN